MLLQFGKGRSLALLGIMSSVEAPGGQKQNSDIMEVKMIRNCQRIASSRLQIESRDVVDDGASLTRS